MKLSKKLYAVLASMGLLLCMPLSGSAQENTISNFASLVEIQQYDRAIHIMAMLLLGFGFLMVFVKKYGRSALTGTFLLVSTALPLYFMMCEQGILGEADGEIKKLILAEFGAASLLYRRGGFGSNQDATVHSPGIAFYPLL